MEQSSNISPNSVDASSSAKCVDTGAVIPIQVSTRASPEVGLRPLHSTRPRILDIPNLHPTIMASSNNSSPTRKTAGGKIKHECHLCNKVWIYVRETFDIGNAHMRPRSTLVKHIYADTYWFMKTVPCSPALPVIGVLIDEIITRCLLE